MRSALLAVLLGCTACAAAPADQHGDPHAYLIVNTPSVERGWAAIDAIQAGLSPADRARIRTTAPIGEGPRMFVDFSGSCSADAELVRSAREIAARGGAGLACSDTPPT